MSENELSEDFEKQRRYLRGFAYRMLGSIAEAEDVVQEAWLRWRSVDRSKVTQPRAFLTQTVARLCMDHLKSARERREVYVGPWLPEPIVDEHELLEPGPDMATELASDLSYAFLLALERLSPLERAAFLLHDVFDEDFAGIASALGKSEAACRQLASRARSHIRDAKPVVKVSGADSERVAKTFLHALEVGDFEQLKQLLTEDVRFTSDGGGRVPAAGIPLLGRERVIKFLSGIRRKYSLPEDAQALFTAVNGQMGCLISANGAPIQTISMEFDQSGLISAIYVVRNPDKLKHLGKVH